MERWLQKLVRMHGLRDKLWQNSSDFETLSYATSTGRGK